MKLSGHNQWESGFGGCRRGIGGRPSGGTGEQNLEGQWCVTDVIKSLNYDCICSTCGY